MIGVVLLCVGRMLGESRGGKRYRPVMGMRRGSTGDWLHDCTHCVRVPQLMAYPSRQLG